MIACGVPLNAGYVPVAAMLRLSRTAVRLWWARTFIVGWAHRRDANVLVRGESSTWRHGDYGDDEKRVAIYQAQGHEVAIIDASSRIRSECHPAVGDTLAEPSDTLFGDGVR